MQRHVLHDATGVLLEVPNIGAAVVAGPTVPADAQVGFAPGCHFIHTDGSGDGDLLYINLGSKASCNFDAVLLSAAGTTALADDALLSFGTVARFSWDTTDANANKMMLQLPAGGATDVPVLMIGQSIESVDFGFHNGEVDPVVSMIGVGARTTSPILEFRKSRGTAASPTVITTGDDLGIIRAYACVAAAEWVESCRITLDSTGTIATTRGGGRIGMSVATDAAPSVMTERVSITGSLGITLTPATDTFLANATGLVVGHTAQETISDGDGGTDLIPEVQIMGTAQADSTLMLAMFSTTDALGPMIAFVKGGNAAIGSHTTVADNEYLGRIVAFGDDGTDLETPAAEIRFVVDGTPAGSQLGGSIELFTTPDGSTTLTKRWTVAETGNLVAATALDIVVPANTDSALEFSDGTTKVIDIDSRNTLKDIDAVTITGFAPTVASAAEAHRNASLHLAAKTVTYTGTTNTTSSLGAALSVGVMTWTDASAMTLATASAVHINAIAAAGGMLTITSSHMISTSVTDCFLTNAGVWTDTSCWESGKEQVYRGLSVAGEAIDRLLAKIVPATWKYKAETELPAITEDGTPTIHRTKINDRGRERVGIVYDDLPEELRAPGEERAISTGILASFGLAAISRLNERLAALEARVA